MLPRQGSDAGSLDAVASGPYGEPMTDTPFTPYADDDHRRTIAAGEHAGLNYAVVKIDTGPGPYRIAICCGYVLLPEGHPWRELDLQWEDSDQGPDVHGGITYGPEDGWIGFGYGHLNDYWPGSTMTRDPGSVERTEAEVEAECRSLCEQAASVSST